MEILKLLTILGALIFIIQKKKPLYLGIGVAIILGLLLYKIPFSSYGRIFYAGVFAKSTISTVLAFYSITFLQRMLEKRERLSSAERAISLIFNSRRVNVTIVPFVIGLLPSAGAVLLSVPIIRKSCGDYLDREEQTFITTYYRHISEAFVPTYASTILALQLSGVSMSDFVAAMLPNVAFLFAFGHIFYVRKLPSLPAASVSEEYGETNIGTTGENKRRLWAEVFRSLWTIIFAVIIVLVFKFPIHWIVAAIVTVNFILEKFSFTDLKEFVVTAFEGRLIFSTVLIMIFTQVLTEAGVMARLPETFASLPIPTTLIYAILFLISPLIAGSQASIAILIPLAFAAIPGAGLGHFIVFMSVLYIAMQVSPAHICLHIVSDAYGTTFGSLVKKTMPILISFLIAVTIYGYFLIEVLKL